MSTEKDEEKEELTEETEDSSDEENSQSLEELLSLPEGLLTELTGANEGVELLITKVKEYVETKESEIEDYQDTVKEFEETIEEREDSLRILKIETSHLQQNMVTLETENIAIKEKCGGLEEQLEILKREFDNTNVTMNETNEEIELIKHESHDHQVTIEELEEELRQTKNELESTRCPIDVPGADRDELLRILDRRQTEISRLTNDWRILSDKLETTLCDKHEIQSRLDEFISQETSICLKEQMFERDKQIVTQQNNWLTIELDRKNSLLMSMKKDLSSINNEKETSLTLKQQEIEHLKELLSSRKSLVEELQSRLDSVNKKVMEQKEEHIEIEEQLRKELSSQCKLSTLYQSAAEEGEVMLKELMSKVNDIQTKLTNVTQHRDHLNQSLVQLQEQHFTMTSTNRDKIESLEEEIRNANDLLRIHSEVLPLATTTKGLSLTQMYTKYVESTTKLREEKEETARLNNYLTQIMEELEEKTPVLQRLRRDHDVLVRTNEELQNKMEMIAEESETLRLEAEESLKFSRVIERENKRLKTLTGDLSRQVRTLLQECEEARGGVTSTHHTLSFDSEVSSSSQVISSHLVEFRSITELQEQNQKLLTVVRELGEEREKDEEKEESSVVKEMRIQLMDTVKELETIRENRERQKEMVEAIVKQRDMYRILLAQSTPLPQEEEEGMELHVSRDSGTKVLTPQKQYHHINTEELTELKEQFEAYRREKLENDKILQEQMDSCRKEASDARFDNIKLTSKLEYANERYQMLDGAHKGLKKELTALNNKETKLMTLLTKHQVTMDTMNTELFSSKDKISRLEVERQSLKNERDALYESEKRSRSLYEQMTKEKHGQNVLLTNLQSIRNNMERNEFDLKQRLNLRIESLEKENVLLKEKNHGNEEKRTQLREAYEKQVTELTKRLDEMTRAKQDKDNTLMTTQQELKELRDEFEIKTNSLTNVTNELQEKNDRLLAIEEDAGLEFRSKIRLLERKLADADAKVVSLTEEVDVSHENCDEYRKLSEQNEQSLRELNQTCDDFKIQMNKDIERLQEQESSLIDERDSEKEKRITEVTSLKEELLETQEALSQMQDIIDTLQTQLESAVEAMKSGQAQVLVAHDEAKRFSAMNIESQDSYQRELVQHGKTMEELATVKQEIETKNNLLLETESIKEKLQVQLDTITATYDNKESVIVTENESLKERCDELTRQNDLSLSEIDWMSARIVTLTQSDYTISSSPSSRQQDDDNSNLLEIVRFVKREKDIAIVKQEMAESECLQLKHKSQKLEKELNDCQSQLKEITETTKLYEQSTVEYKEVMAKVQTLNVLSDSNTLLRDEKDRLKEKLQGLEDQVSEYESQLLSSKEALRRITTQKDSLLAEKAALRNEVERWNKRTSQLIEQYNKIDPEEYKRLLEEKDVREAENNKLSSDLLKVKEELEIMKKTSQEETDGLMNQIQELRQLAESKEVDVSQLTNEGNDLKKVNAKLRELGRKFRALYEEKKKECEEMQTQKEVTVKQMTELKEANTRASTEENVVTELRQQSDTTKQELEAVKLKLADKEDKFNKVVKTAKSLKLKFETTKSEKEDLSKELEDAKNVQNSLSTQIEELKTDCENRIAAVEENVQREYNSYTRELEDKIEKLEDELRAKKRSRVVQPQVVESTSTTNTLPSAAVRPTVTTTPTASIRPMPLQITTAPTAHVTPTQVSTSVPSTVESTATQSTNSQLASATVFVRSTSPLIQPSQHSQIMHSTSSSSNEADNTSRPSVKRSRDDSMEYPPNKRCNITPATTIQQQQTNTEMEPSTTTNDNDSLLIVVVESSDDVSPDTQTERDHPITDQSSPQSVGEADLPATIPADTTSDEATEPVEETGLTSSQVHVYEISDDNEAIVNDSEEVLIVEEVSRQQGDEGDDIIVMATEPLESANTEEEDEDEQEMEEDEYTPEPVDTGSDEEEIMEEEEEELPEERSPQLPQTAAIIAEESVGLPDDEVTVDLPPPQQASTTVRQLPNPAHRLRLQMGDSRAHTPGVIDLVVDDHQVPCTPVLAEDKQLGKNPPAQSVPAESDNNNNNSTTATSSQQHQTQSLPPQTQPQSQQHDDDCVTIDEGISSLDRTTEERSTRIGEDGDIHEEVIDEIIGVVDSSSSSEDEDDVEDGQLPESPRQDVDSQQPPSVSMTTTPSSTEYIPPVVSITSTMADEGMGSGGGVTGETSGTRQIRIRPRPIVWNQPTNSGQSASEPPKKAPKSTSLRRPSKGVHRGRGRGRGSRGKPQ